MDINYALVRSGLHDVLDGLTRAEVLDQQAESLTAQKFYSPTIRAERAAEQARKTVVEDLASLCRSMGLKVEVIPADYWDVITPARTVNRVNRSAAE